MSAVLYARHRRSLARVAWVRTCILHCLLVEKIVRTHRAARVCVAASSLAQRAHVWWTTSLPRPPDTVSTCLICQSWRGLIISRFKRWGSRLCIMSPVRSYYWAGAGQGTVRKVPTVPFAPNLQSRVLGCDTVRFDVWSAPAPPFCCVGYGLRVPCS